MLVLSRKESESLIINGDIKVTVVRITKVRGVPRVKIGIEAPKDVTVHRQEIWELIEKKKGRGEE